MVATQRRPEASKFIETGFRSSGNSSSDAKSSIWNPSVTSNLAFSWSGVSAGDVPPRLPGRVEGILTVDESSILGDSSKPRAAFHIRWSRMLVIWRSFFLSRGKLTVP